MADGLANGVHVATHPTLPTRQPARRRAYAFGELAVRENLGGFIEAELHLHAGGHPAKDRRVEPRAVAVHLNEHPRI